MFLGLQKNRVLPQHTISLNVWLASAGHIAATGYTLKQITPRAIETANEVASQRNSPGAHYIDTSHDLMGYEIGYGRNRDMTCWRKGGFLGKRFDLRWEGTWTVAATDWLIHVP